MRRITMIAGATVVAAVGLTAGIAGGAPRQTTPPEHDPYTSSVGVYVQSYNDDTRGNINCSRGGLTLVHGDGTLFMENTSPGTIICFITIKKPVTT